MNARPVKTPSNASLRIDLNCDMGEVPSLIADGTEEAIMRHVTSVNVACGGHAGDEATMEATVRTALRHGCAVGAHPSYPDREHFGRRVMTMPAEDLARSIHEQLSRLAEVAARCGATLSHVKPHGALYNQAARDPALAEVIALGVTRFDARLPLFGLAGSAMLQAFSRAGFRAIAEAFADRAYEPDGRLRSRDQPGALLTSPEEAAAQALAIVRDRQARAHDGAVIPIAADTLCLHGDTPGAARIAAAVAARLRAAGVLIAPPPSTSRGSP